jgi:hypothetical protein
MSKGRGKERAQARHRHLLEGADVVRTAFDRQALRRLCEAREEDVPTMYDALVIDCDERPPHDWYAFVDRGADVLAVAHLDTVAGPFARACEFVDTAAGEVVFSRALDDRLGAYVVLELLPALGVTCDVLLTVGEETGRSTAAFFDAPREYDHVVEFDRGGTDVVLYQYDDDALRDLVEAAGARVGDGTFSDIAELEHLGVKCLNWGVGYQDYHSSRSHAFLEDTFLMVSKYLTFHAQNYGTRLPHDEALSFAQRWADPFHVAGDTTDAAEYAEWLKWHA